MTRGKAAEVPASKRSAVKVPKGDRPYAHPCYWAGFFLIGDAE